ncbi:MAG: TIM barrel protein [Oscillospiraceae bacterium]|nr:TIM barrel protein [Candidatus Equicaccousia limihippi]
MMARFGPAGNGIDFYDKGLKHTEQVPAFLKEMGLNAFEYQCGRGVNISQEKALMLAPIFSQNGISVSLHAPYYISMSSLEEEKRLGSLKYVYQSALAVKALGGNRIVIHSGSCGKQPREQALVKAVDTMTKAREMLVENGFSDVIMCPETMGKIGQLGTLDEVIALCEIDESIYPCIDFGHLNARTHGGLSKKEDFEDIFTLIENKLGSERAKHFHSHFSKIEYTEGGEKRHLTFEDEIYGPSYELMLDCAAAHGCDMTVICESDGTQARDAKTMKDYFEEKSV